MDFDKAFDRLMGNEGGYSNNPVDPGGETNWGITWPVLREAIASNIIPVGTTIASLTRDQAKAIYYAFFWLRGQMNQYDGAISFQAFDAAVNHGIPRAVKLLQKAAGVKLDGEVGPVTVAAIKSKRVTDMLALFIAARLEFWTDLSTWSTFGRGWAKRCVADIRYAVIDYNAEGRP